MKVQLPRRFFLSGHTTGFCLLNQKLEPLYRIPSFSQRRNGDNTHVAKENQVSQCFPCETLQSFLYFLLPRELLKDMPEYYVPEVIEDLTSKQVLTTELIEGTSLDKIENPNQETINKVLLESYKKFDAKLALCKVITGVSIGFEVGICPAVLK